ncbi:uncharacterized mitochondrial protein AtMg00240-like [Solanum tuberosum]|uniref:uncharacterized mitochondrial protein AtMg00240-like n=1 Tax=Solanum tuberosum TaxID=4113 RepID=UPI00073A1DC9|nr:PREDICTED: uncharacterized mitochondrial protein AtMg00240-like [Solanum tuberosum]
MYRGIIGSLLYLIASRPDIVFSVEMCARFQVAPKESHLKVAKRILRYLKGTQNLVLFYPTCDTLDLISYVDADYAGFLVDRKSTSASVDQAATGGFSILTDTIPLICNNTNAMNIAKNPI